MRHAPRGPAGTLVSRWWISLLIVFTSIAHAADVPIITTIAGGGPDELPALVANISGGWLAHDSAGRLIVAPSTFVYRIDAAGHLQRLAGTGWQERSGTGGAAREASVNPSGVAVAADDSIYLAERWTIRRIDPVDGTIEQVASGFSEACGMALDRAGFLYLADKGRHQVLRVEPRTGEVEVIAGTGERGFSGDGGPAREARLAQPNDVAVDSAGHLFIADRRNHRIRRVDAETGLIETVAGTGERGFSGDGGPATAARLNTPTHVALDLESHLLISDARNGRIRRVDLVTGTIETVAGNGTEGPSGDGGLAVDAGLGAGDVAVAADGALLISSGAQIRRVDRATGIIDTVAGNGEFWFCCDGYPAASSTFAGPVRVRVASDGSFYFSDIWGHRVRRVDGATGIITTVAGTGVAGSEGDGGPADEAQLASPLGLALDDAGNLFISETGISFMWGFGSRVRRVDAVTGRITTVAGTGEPGFSGDGGPAVEAQLATPHGLAFDASGDLLIADAANGRIRRVDAASGIITTIAGTGRLFSSEGDGGPALDAAFDRPVAIALDRDGNSFIVEAGGHHRASGHRIRRIDAETGIISRVAGYAWGRFRDGVPATESGLQGPQDIAIDRADNLYIAEQWIGRVRFIDARTGIIDTIAGGWPQLTGNGIPAMGARIMNMFGIALDQRGSLYLVDHTPNPSIRMVTFPNRVPIADAGRFRTLECDSTDGTRVEQDGSRSVDIDGDELTFSWSGPFREGGGQVEGIAPTVTLEVGETAIDLVVSDGELFSDPAQVTHTVIDTISPAGAIVIPSLGSCHGRAALPLRVEDDFVDRCDAELDREFDPGASFVDHGDHVVTLTVADDAGNTVAISTSFTIDTVRPIASILAAPDQLVFPFTMPGSDLFLAEDDDGAAGGVVREVIRLSGCIAFDGNEYGNGDGLLRDEMLRLDVVTLCAIASRCGFRTLDRPELRVEGIDCGGNLGQDARSMTGTLRLIPGICGE